jgi:hypothetical protein
MHRENDALPGRSLRAEGCQEGVAREDQEVQCVLKRALKVTCAVSLLRPFAFGSGESVEVVGTIVPVGATVASAVLTSRSALTPTPAVKNSRTRTKTHTPRLIVFAHMTLPLTHLTIAPPFPAAPTRRRACSRMEVALFMATPFFRSSGGEESLTRALCDYEEKPKEGDIPPS